MNLVPKIILIISSAARYVCAGDGMRNSKNIIFAMKERSCSNIVIYTATVKECVAV